MAPAVGALQKPATTQRDARIEDRPRSKLYRKGKTASESRSMGHTLTDHRHGLIVNARVTQADGFAEREAAKAKVKTMIVDQLFVMRMAACNLVRMRTLAQLRPATA